jgi:hypothetical protein
MSNIQVQVERDSVCMGDDVKAPHCYKFTLSSDAPLQTLFDHLAKKHYLASVSGKDHSWDAVVKGKVLVSFRGNNKQPEPSETLTTKLSNYSENGILKLWFNYSSSAT